MTSWEDYEILECRGCHGMTFRHVNRNTEHTDYDRHTGEEFLIDTEELYPRRATGRAGISDAFVLPPHVQLVYRETLEALRNKLPILAGVGLRALVEAMCKEHDAKGRNLEERIDSLASQGLITRDGAEVLHSLRIMGNKAAHEVLPQSEELLGSAMDVVEYALTGLYILPATASKLPRRSAARGNAAGGTDDSGAAT